MIGINKNKIIILGAGGHARSCIDVIDQENKFIIHGLVGLKSEINKKINNYNVIGSEEILSDKVNQISYAHVGIGSINNLLLRIKLYEMLVNLNFKLPSIISPHSYVSRDAVIGDGTIIMHNIVINSNVKIGKNCIINTSSIIEHDVIIGNHCNIATGVIINGGVELYENCFVGSGTIIRDNVKIKKNNFIKMGSRIIKSTEVSLKKTEKFNEK